MLINEACNLTGLTKKAISYYEEQGLVKSQKNDKLDMEGIYVYY